MNDDINDGIGTYDVVLLVENEVSKSDARKVHGLHESIKDQVVYHVLVPISPDAQQVRAALAAVAAEAPLTTVAVTEADIEETQRLDAEAESEAEAHLAGSLKHLQATHARAEGSTIDANDVIGSLKRQVAAVDAREVIVLTEPHVVSEFFKLDWASKAERHLKVPVLHLLEHESINAQASQNEGLGWL